MMMTLSVAAAKSAAHAAPPANLAAIDAGSNGIRMLIARARSPRHIQVLKKERASVRLGHDAFTKHAFDKKTISQAVRTFAHFREMMDRHHVRDYRAVTTSAAREARNRAELIDRIRDETGIHLEVIEGEEEARLIRAAVMRRSGGRHPDLIIDLGGGSLELNLMDAGELKACHTLPLGCVRLMEGFGVTGPIKNEAEWRIEEHIHDALHRTLPRPPYLGGGIAAGCGGNAEALAKILGGRSHGVPSIDFHVLDEQLPEILRLGIAGRMRKFDIRKDRAEVIGIAALVFSTMARAFHLREMLVPGVGVREGLLHDLVAARFGRGD